MRRRFEAALMMLNDAGPSGRRVGYAVQAVADRKQWLDGWLATEVVVDRPDGKDERSRDRGRGLRATDRSRATAPIELHRGDAIRAIRIERGVSQAQLARELGVSASYLSQVENARRLASRGMLGRIADWLNANAAANRGRRQTPGALAAIGVAAGAERLAAHRCPPVPAGARYPGKDERT